MTAADRRILPRIMLNSDGAALISRFQAVPMGVEGLVDEVFAPLEDSHVDAVLWALGSAVDGIHASNQWVHRTKIGETFGEDMTDFPSEEFRRRKVNALDLFEKGTDSAEVVVNHARKIGMGAWLSIRMNDCHEGIVGGRYVGKIKRQHPEWTLGERAPVRMFRFAFDFLQPGPYEYRFGLIKEAAEQYDIDGFELDFLRHPIFFADEDVARGRPIMTRLVRDVRKALDEAGAKKGRRIALAVRVPGTADMGVNVGLDVGAWIVERLIDVVIAGTMCGGVFRLPVERFLAAAKGTGAAVYANFNTACGAVAWSSVESRTYTDQMHRAWAATHWRLGADGLYSWNANCFRLFIDENWEGRPLREMGEPGEMALLDKHYLVDRMCQAPPGTYEDYVHRVTPPAELPMRVGRSGAAIVKVELAEDFGLARQKGVDAEAELRVRFDSGEAAQAAAIRFNGEPVAVERRENVWCFGLLDTQKVRLGENALEVTLPGAGAGGGDDGVIEAAEVFVRYGRG